MITKEQKRSEFALAQIEKFKAVDSELANFIVGTPTMMMTNGLGQTLAFLLSKKKDKFGTVYNSIKEWLMRELPYLKAGSETEFLKSIATMDAEQYLRAQQEALMMLSWLKRYARAFEKDERH